MFDGDCEEALNFYAKAFQGAIKDLMRFEGSPVEVKTDQKRRVMHANFVAGDLHFMASDTGGDGISIKGLGHVHLSVDLRDKEEQQKVFDELSKGGAINMPLQDTFWGARFGMLTDRFGINWMLNCELPKK